MLKLISTYALLALSLLPSLASALPAADDHASHATTASDGNTWLATSIGPDCITGARYHGVMQGKNITIADVPTYYAEPPVDAAEKKVIFFFSDVYGPFLDNNFMLQDWFASQGFHVLGIDYFFGDPIQNHPEPGFNITAWLAKSQRQAAEAVPKWKAAVIEEFGEDAKYAAVGYCFGASYAMEATEVVASAFAHPAFLTENHFRNVQSPLLLSLAETDSTFSTAASRRAMDILMEERATYHLQQFSGVQHGFATRADPNDANAVWAKEESGRSVIGWFTRFMAQ